ncbi:MAG: hypothetical protein PHC66_03575 [Candidatus Nanoarchaeia archaeon]|nr:hypothetical protein [Candidatus Nanoarchaeia archaeon]MDD5239816.1 hypothetical protein [Candidatus Nanoarchaeia archaeon]
MFELENILGKVTKESPEAYCSQHGKYIKRYFQIKVSCVTSISPEEIVLKTFFEEYPTTEVLSGYSNVLLEGSNYYSGTLLIPKIPKKVKKQPLIPCDIIL